MERNGGRMVFLCCRRSARINRPTLTAWSSTNYWAKLKERLNKEGTDELLTNCHGLKMTAADGERRLTDVAITEQILRII